MKRSVRNLGAEELAGRRALVRVDYNVPLGADGEVRDAARIEATVPTLRYLLKRRARPVLLSHLGRPHGTPDPRLSLASVRPVLEHRLGVPVHFEASTDSPRALERSRRLPEEEVLLLENTRFLNGETTDDDELAVRFARLGDLFVNDAFGSMHRAHASTVGITRHLRPAVAGLLVEAELRALGTLMGRPDRPFVVALGGAKIADKIPLLDRFLDRADALLIGGAMANTFFLAQGLQTGRSLVEAGSVQVAKRILNRAGGKLSLPLDLVVVDDPDAERPVAETVAPDRVPDTAMAVDIGERTRHAYGVEVRRARTLFWNGPMGWFEREAFAAGTRALAEAAVEATRTRGFTVIGGGDSARAIRQAGFAERVSFVSTGGGASLEYLARGSLPGVEALDDATVE
ncbi:MAG: phosphoglycerate kinase [Gemmatimonadota bacterium]